MAINYPYIGQLDRKIKVYSFEKLQNDIGEEKETKELISSPFSYVEDTGGAEMVEGKVMHSVGRSYTIRWNSNIAKKGVHYIVEDDGVDYRVEAVLMIGRKKFLKLVVQNYE